MTMKSTIRGLAGAVLVLSAFGVAVAKLPPAPPPTDAQKAAAEEKKAKDAAAAEAAKVSQARAEDRVAARYYAEMKAKGKAVPAPQMAPSAPPPPAAKAGAPAPKAAAAAPKAAPKK